MQMGWTEPPTNQQSKKLSLHLNKKGDKECRQLMTLFVNESQLQFQCDVREHSTIFNDLSKARKERLKFQGQLRKTVKSGKMSMCKRMCHHTRTFSTCTIPTQGGTLCIHNNYVNLCNYMQCVLITICS